MSDSKRAQQAEMLGNRLRKTARHRRKWARREGVTCYRLYDRDIPEIPLVVDWYEGRLHVAEYSRGGADPVDDAELWLVEMALGVASALEIDDDDVYVKTRQRQRGLAQYEKRTHTRPRFVVTEGGHRFWVDLGGYLDTGLFLDHRLTRARLAQAAEGKRVLNLYGYTGAFTVYAAAAGAAATTTVDMSNTYVKWAADNLALNGIAGPAHELVRDDVRPWLAGAIARKAQYDLIVVDPPTFSNSKRMQGVFEVQRDHPKLIAEAFAVLARGGGLLFSTNARRFKLALPKRSNMIVEETTDATVPPDFPRRPHRSWYLTKR